MENDIVICPESTKNGVQIREWVNNLKQNPRIFYTNSIYLLRELELQQIPVTYINITENLRAESTDINRIGNIEILDRELEQSDRYIYFENTHD